MNVAQQKEYNALLKEAEEIQNRIKNGVNIRLKTAERLVELEEKIAKLEEKTLKAKQAQYKQDAETASLSEKAERISKSLLGNLSKVTGEGKDFSKALNLAAKSGDEATIKAGNAFADLLEKVNAGELGQSGILAALGDTDFGEHEEAVKKLADTLGKTPSMQQIFKVKAQTFAALNTASGGLLATVRAIIAATGPIGLLVAAAGFLVAEVIKAVGQAIKLRQEFGTSAVQSGKLVANMKAAGIAALAAGGNMAMGEDAVKGMLDAFGDVNVVTNSTAGAAAKLMANTGMAGSEAGKLLKVMSDINGNSIETNVNTLLAKDNLAEAGGVRTANVMRQIAGDTDMFARAGERGADALFRAAISAEKMGIQLTKIDQLANNMIDVEKAMESQFAISTLLGRQVDFSALMFASQSGTQEDILRETQALIRDIGVENFANNRIAMNALQGAFGGMSIADLRALERGEGPGISGGQEVFQAQKDTLSAANKSAEIQTKQLNEIKALREQNERLQNDLIKATKDLGAS